MIFVWFRRMIQKSMEKDAIEPFNWVFRQNTQEDRVRALHIVFDPFFKAVTGERMPTGFVAATHAEPQSIVYTDRSQALADYPPPPPSYQLRPRKKASLGTQVAMDTQNPSRFVCKPRKGRRRTKKIEDVVEALKRDIMINLGIFSETTSIASAEDDEKADPSYVPDSE